MKQDIEKLKVELNEYYEAAGFSNYSEKVLNNLTNDQIVELYTETFKENDEELEQWEREHVYKD